MQSQQPLHRPDSPVDKNSQNMLHHLNSQDPMFLHGQNGLFTPTNGNSLGSRHLQQDFTSDLDSQNQQAKTNGFGPGAYSRNTFNSYPNANRPRHQNNTSVLTTNFYPPSADVLGSQLTSPVSSHMPNFDNRPSLDIGPGHGNYKPYFDGFPASATQPHQVGAKPGVNQQLPQPNAYSAQAPSFSMSSQTPYGPHIPSNGPAHVGAATTRLDHPAAVNTGTSSNQQEEISTIFVVGFPEDMQEREFQNMFTFSPGFEAATLKIPNKEYTAYGAVPSNRQGYQYDPYNLVTMNQGGVVVDGGRDGTVSWPAAPPGEDGNSPYGGVPQRKQIIGFAKFRSREEALGARDVLQGRRVDIEKGAVLKAEMAKKNLHTKRGVGPVGNAPNPSLVAAANSLNLNATAPYHHSLINTGGIIPPNAADLYLNNDTLTPGERRMGAIEAMGLGRATWREQGTVPQEASSILGHNAGLVRDEEDKRAGILNTMGLTTPASRGPRERAEEEERERRKKEKEMRLRASTMSAFENYHSISASGSPGISRQPSNNSSLLSPTENGISHHSSPMIPNGNGFQAHLASVSSKVPEETLVGPWDHIGTIGKRGTTPRPITISRRSSPPIPGPASAPIPSDSGHPFSPAPGADQKGDAVPHSAAPEVAMSAMAAAQALATINDPTDQELARAINNLAVSTNGGKTSPQLPSPASGASTGSSVTRNGVDQNPPINTLYVGNLPTSPPPPGYPQDYLEDSLRELFSSRPGFRRLCFRQKNNGPMCFVEFEDVHFATKALNELYGNTLKGLVKGGGIRLSYSKNPLGVRTPTNAANNGPSPQQQQQQQVANSASQQGSVALSANSEVFQPRQPFNTDDQQAPGALGRAPNSIISPPSSASTLNSFLTSPPPPPRFFSSSPSSNTFGSVSSSSSLTGASSAFLPRSSNTLYGFGHGSAASAGTGGSTISSFGLSLLQHSSIPDQNTDDHLHSPHYMTPPGNNLEATRAG